ncbi:MAG: tyrosine-type recombinase/integrase [Paludibaculum sp.]
MPKKLSILPPGLYAKRDSLWVFVGRNGKKYYRPANTTSVTEALLVRDQLLKEVLAGEKQHAGVGNITCAVLLTNYLDRLQRTSKAGSDTFTITKGTVEKHVLPFFGKVKAERLDRKKLEAYQKAKLQEVGQVSINRQLGYLRTAFKQGKRDKLTNNEPDFSTSILRSAEEENVRTGIITESQYAQLVPALDGNIGVQTLFVLCWNTGVRPAEAFRLKWDQVNWHDRLISVYKRQAKIGKPRFLPLRQQAYEQLLKWRDFLNEYVRRPTYIFTSALTGQPMRKNSYRIPWQHACLKCGFGQAIVVGGRTTIKTDLLFYDSRRAFRTYLPSDVAKEDGKSVMGHEQDSTFGRYLQSQEAAKRVLGALDAEQPKPTMPIQDKIKAIKELGEMLEGGLITPAEFAALKAEL